MSLRSRGLQAQDVWLNRGRALWKGEVPLRKSFCSHPRPASDPVSPAHHAPSHINHSSYSRVHESSSDASRAPAASISVPSSSPYRSQRSRFEGILTAPSQSSSASASSSFSSSHSAFRGKPFIRNPSSSTNNASSAQASPAASSSFGTSPNSSFASSNQSQSQRSAATGVSQSPFASFPSTSQSNSPFRGKPFDQLPSSPSVSPFSAQTSASTLSSSSSNNTSHPTLSPSHSPFRRSSPAAGFLNPFSHSTASSTSAASATPVVFTTPKSSPFGMASPPAAPSVLSQELLNALAKPPPASTTRPSLSAYRSTSMQGLPRRVEFSENQRLYEIEQKKLREQQQNAPALTPMKAWFKNDLSPAATRSPLQGTEVTSVHQAGDITRWKADYRSTTSSRIIQNPETAAEIRLSMMKMAKKKEMYLERSWQAWLAKHGPVSEAQDAPKPKAEQPFTGRLVKEAPVRLSRRIRIQSFSKLTGISTRAVIECLLRSGLFKDRESELNSNTVIDMAAQEYVCIEFGKVPEVPQSRDVERAPAEQGEPRAPVVCIMGHVDHGKTSLLDRLRSTNVVSGEAGGITQSIGAFTVASGAVFLDTPGHAAFSSMRARGADKNMTDLVVLVVAIDSGVQPQTIEAIELAQANNLPIVVAITKCDLDVDETNVRRQLLRHGLQSEENGGDTIFVRVSAKTGMGMDELLESIGLVAEMLDLRAPVQTPCRASVVECSQQQGFGCMVNVVLRSGTVKVGDIVICGTECVKVRALIDERGQKLQSCGPSTPVSVAGFKELDAMGAILRGVASEEEGKAIISEREAAQQALQYEKALETSAPAAGETPAEGERSLLAVVKACTKGSLEAFLKYVNALPQDEVKIMVLKSGVGPIHEGDVHMASLLGAKIFGFGLSLSDTVEDAARKKKVAVFAREVIYQLMDDFRDAVALELPPVPRVDVVGTAEVLQVFKREGKKRQSVYAAGCRVVGGKLLSRDPKGGKIEYRVSRNGVQLAQAGLERLFHFKDEVQSIDKGQECCLVLQDVKDYEPGDSIECISTSMLPPVYDDSAGRAS